MKDIKFKVEINGIDIKEGDIIEIKGESQDAWGDSERFNYIGKVTYIDRVIVDLDCSEKYNKKTLEIDICDINTVKIL